MRRLLRAWRDDRSGLAATEFALIVPVLATLLILGSDGWLQANQTSDVRTALQTGARYYESGGSDDNAAQAAMLAAWASKPANGSLSTARSCTCGSTPTVCTSTCPDSSLPSVFVQLTAQATYSGIWQSHAVSQSNVVRIR